MMPAFGALYPWSECASHAGEVLMLLTFGSANSGRQSPYRVRETAVDTQRLGSEVVQETISEQKTAVPQGLLEEFPTELTGKIFQKTGILSEVTGNSLEDGTYSGIDRSRVRFSRRHFCRRGCAA
jgi:hypothetical protein